MTFEPNPSPTLWNGDLEPGILRELAISELELDPWGIESLRILSELSNGDEKRLYLLDILRAKPFDESFSAEFINWEIEEEIQKSHFNLFRLADRIAAILLMSGPLEDGAEIEILARLLSRTLRLFYVKGETRTLIIGLKSAIIAAGKIPGMTELLLGKKIPGTKTAIIELIRGTERYDDGIFLISAISENQYLFTDINIRREISSKLIDIGDYELAFCFSMKSIDIYPQDQKTALIALKSAIILGNDHATLVAGGTLLAMKNHPTGIPYHNIASAALRRGRVEYSIDLLRRRRMKLGIEGHRLRVGIPFHRGEYEDALEEISRTPKPHSTEDSIKTYKIMSLSSLHRKKQAMESIAEIKDPLEKRMLGYFCQYNSGEYNKAMGDLNRHFLNYGMRPINQKWAENECDFVHLGVDGDTPESANFGKISVIMTCHKWNPVLKLAIDSVLKQSYPNIEFIFVDDHSSEEDVLEYDKLLGDGVIRLRMDKNLGTYACRNEGIKIAKGEFITFADSDDWIHPEKIANSLEFLVESRAEAVVGRYIRMNEDGKIMWNGARFARFALVGMTFRTTALRERLRGFDSRMRHSADSELFERARIILGKHRVLRFPVVGIIALDSKNSLTNTEDLAINWFGSKGERSWYNNSYRRHHLEMSSKGAPRKNDFFSFRPRIEDVPENFLMLRQKMGFNVLPESKESETKTESDEILVTMCTYPGGFATVEGAVSSLLFNQTREISELRLVVNGSKLPEGIPDDERLIVIQCEEDVTDKGKFIEIKDFEGYVLTVDDDIFYPGDYVEKMIEFVDEFGRKSLIGVHGAHIPSGPPITRWWEYSNVRRSHVFGQEMPEFIPVNVIGTGTLAFHTSIGKPNTEEFDHQRMVDLHLAVWAQENEIPMYVCPRRRDWLAEINSGNVGRIWQTANEDGSMQHRMLQVLQRCGGWALYGEKNVGGFTLNGSFGEFQRWVNRELCPGMMLPEKKVRHPPIEKNPLVTIYIPAYNCEEYIIQSINSALNQTYKNIEICVHNDGSTDRTLAKLRRRFTFNRKVKISTGKNKGIGNASNSAIKNGSGELILQLDSDDILHPEALDNLVPEIKEGVVCSYGSFIRISETGEKIDEGWDWPYYTHERLLRSMIVHHPRLFRRSSWEEVGGFDEEITNAVDYDFFLKLGEIGEMLHIRKKLYSYRIHQSSTSQEKRSLQTDNTIIVQRKSLERLGLGEFVNFAPNPDFPRRINYRYEAFSNRP